jgi:hypothetical protein
MLRSVLHGSEPDDRRPRSFEPTLAFRARGGDVADGFAAITERLTADRFVDERRR